jgi:hypothetical protein
MTEISVWKVIVEKDEQLFFEEKQNNKDRAFTGSYRIYNGRQRPLGKKKRSSEKRRPSGRLLYFEAYSQGVQ